MFNIIALNQALCGLRTFKRYTCITKHRKREKEREKNSHSILRLAVHFIIIDSFSSKKRTTNKLHIYIFFLELKKMSKLYLKNTISKMRFLKKPFDKTEHVHDLRFHAHAARNMDHQISWATKKHSQGPAPFPSCFGPKWSACLRSVLNAPLGSLLYVIPESTMSAN